MNELILTELLSFFENSTIFGLLANSRMAYFVYIEILYFFSFDMLLTYDYGFYTFDAVFSMALGD